MADRLSRRQAMVLGAGATSAAVTAAILAHSAFAGPPRATAPPAKASSDPLDSSAVSDPPSALYPSDAPDPSGAPPASAPPVARPDIPANVGAGFRVSPSDLPWPDAQKIV